MNLALLDTDTFSLVTKGAILPLRSGRGCICACSDG